MFSSRIVMDSCLTSRFFIHLEFIFVYGVREWSSFILLHVAPFIEETVFSTVCFFLLYQILVAQRAKGPFLCSLFCSIDLCVFLCQYPAVFVITALQYSLKPGNVMPPALFFLFNISLAIQGLFWFHTNLKAVCSSSEKCHWYFDWDGIESVDCSGQHRHFNYVYSSNK